MRRPIESHVICHRCKEKISAFPFWWTTIKRVKGVFFLALLYFHWKFWPKMKKMYNKWNGKRPNYVKWKPTLPKLVRNFFIFFNFPNPIVKISLKKSDYSCSLKLKLSSAGNIFFRYNVTDWNNRGIVRPVNLLRNNNFILEITAGD